MQKLPPSHLSDLLREQGIDMQCVNPNCGCDKSGLRGGSFHLLELEASEARRPEGAEGGFPMNSSLQRYFWLCGECTKVFSVTKWTTEGVVLTSRRKLVSTVDHAASQTMDSAAGGTRSSFHFVRWKSRQQRA